MPAYDMPPRNWEPALANGAVPDLVTALAGANIMAAAFFEEIPQLAVKIRGHSGRRRDRDRLNTLGDDVNFDLFTGRG